MCNCIKDQTYGKVKWQVLNTFLKSKSSSCRHVVISDKWLKTPNSTSLDRASPLASDRL
ncbi:hypothetical protein [Fonticella tunisiensis]|uniref:hypothetical protein n=1 Tax=Fonticella tunisiensis TaxID=1096341 RepID=UPI001414D038|nr:hypothetical protein [Fonticella tunisiensis]